MDMGDHHLVWTEGFGRDVMARDQVKPFLALLCEARHGGG